MIAPGLIAGIEETDDYAGGGIERSDAVAFVGVSQGAG
jgi:hypothetical protein